MKQTLSMRLGQQLAMTPQLQQAIRLMQLSALELRTEVQQAIETNPMLELIEDGDEDGEGVGEGERAEVGEGERAEVGEGERAEVGEGERAEVGEGERAGDGEAEGRLDDQDHRNEDEAEFSDQAEYDADDVDDGPEDSALDSFADEDAPVDQPLDVIPDDLPVDVTWDDIYQPTTAASSGGSALGEPDERSFDERNSPAETLLDYLHWQLNLTRMSQRDRVAAHAILDSVDDNGMLTTSVEDLLAALDPALRFEAAEMEAVLKLVQRFDPPGVAARDLAECLFLQLDQLAADTPWRSEAIELVRRHFHLLAKRDFAALGRRTKLSPDELVETMTLIRSLNPRPGAAVGDAKVEYMEPDVVVVKRNGRWTVELNDETAPRIRINGVYAGLVKRAATSADGQYLKDHLQDAKWFLKNLEYRNETLLKVASQIVKRQQGFLERGDEAMQPLVLADIAAAVDRHESTISRVTTRKYMDTPRGIFELKYFFSSHVADANGTDISSTAIRAHIKKLCGAEDPRKPLSDNKIAELLKARGINVARRTVAKYRESMAIPPSNERKRLL